LGLQRASTPHARIETQRVLDTPAAAVLRLVRDPSSYADWVAGLRSFEPGDDDNYVADVGFLGRSKRRAMRLATCSDDCVVWESVGGSSRHRWEIRVEPLDFATTSISFVWEKWGSGSVFGLRADSPLFRSALEAVTRRSLARMSEHVQLESATS
jgi:hypothetical protein